MTSQLKPVRVPFWGPLTAQVHGIYRRAFPPNEQISLTFLHASSVRPGAQFLAWIDPKQPTSVDGVARVVAMTYSQRAHGLLYLAFLAVNDQLRSAGIFRDRTGRRAWRPKSAPASAPTAVL